MTESSQETKSDGTKPSQFNVVTDYEPTGEVLAFNTSTGALVAFPQETAPALRAALEPSARSSGGDDSLNEVLIDHGFLIRKDDDEVGTVLRRLQLGINDPNRLDVFILPNMKCNFACPYCFEEHRASRMSDEVAQHLLAWFEQTIPQFKTVLVSWFGGEPLLSFDRLLEIQGAIQRMCRASGVDLNAHITTNGYLLTPDRAAQLTAVGIHSYQITMDGPPEIHNKGRVLKGRGDSFGRIFGNLCALAANESEASIKLRVNFDADTLPRVPELLEMFPLELRSRLNLVLEPIFGQGSLYVRQSIRGLAQAVEATYGVARRMGFTATTAGLRPSQLTYCYADRVSEFVFNHQGDVFKCTVGNFTEKERMGVLTSDGRVAWEGEGYDEWMAIPAVDDKCRACTFLPMCMGGCRKTRKYTGRSSDDCTLPFAAMDDRVRQRYSAELDRREEQHVPI